MLVIKPTLAVAWGGDWRDRDGKGYQGNFGGDRNDFILVVATTVTQVYTLSEVNNCTSKVRI
jgi:hypothetical protein